MSKEPRPRRSFTKEFKQHIVELSQAGVRRQDIIRQYSLTPSAYDRWIQQAKQQNHYQEIEQMSDEQLEILRLRKEVEDLKMENDILKQAALILAKKNDI